MRRSVFCIFSRCQIRHRKVFRNETSVFLTSSYHSSITQLLSPCLAAQSLVRFHSDGLRNFLAQSRRLGTFEKDPERILSYDCQRCFRPYSPSHVSEKQTYALTHGTDVNDSGRRWKRGTSGRYAVTSVNRKLAPFKPCVALPLGGIADSAGDG